MIKIDNRSSRPIYQQIIDGVKENILKGTLKSGDKLPSVRELSAEITTNPNTVSRAYMELERLKITETIRGRGTFVASSYKPQMDEDTKNILREKFRKIIIEYKYMGVSANEIKKIADELYDEYTNL